MKKLLRVGMVGSLMGLVVSCVAPAPRSSDYGAVRPLPPRTVAAPQPTQAQGQTYGRSAAEQGMPPPDGEVLYQRRDSDAFGSTTYTSRTQVRGPVVEERYIGNQAVMPGEPVYRPHYQNGVPQAGYVPTGTSTVYDPATGRWIPVRRR